MIKINTSKVDNWEEIKKRHKKYIDLIIKPKIETIIEHKILGVTNDEIKLLTFIFENLYKLLFNNFNMDKEFFEKLCEKVYSKEKLETRNYDTQIFEDFSKIKDNKKSYEYLIEKYKLKDDIKYLKRDELKEIVQTFKNSIKKPNKEEEKMNLMEFIFNYSDFSSKAKEKSNGWGRHSLLTMMGIEVCPYCQRNYITNYNDEDNKELTTADLDHFYPQAQYPYLALSLYNFIPSCHTCNSTMKGGEPTGIDTHIYPYTDSMEEDIKFTIETDSFMDNIFTKNQNLNIDIDVISTVIEKNKKIENNLKTFKLREVYKNSHSKYVGDLIHNFQKYPKSYTKTLGEIFLETPKENNKENKSDEEIKRELEEKKSYQEKLQILNDNFQEIIKKPYIDKIEKGEPLAKLTKDIMEELGIK